MTSAALTVNRPAASATCDIRKDTIAVWKAADITKAGTKSRDTAPIPASDSVMNDGAQIMRAALTARVSPAVKPIGENGRIRMVAGANHTAIANVRDIAGRGARFRRQSMRFSASPMTAPQANAQTAISRAKAIRNVKTAMYPNCRQKGGTEVDQTNQAVANSPAACAHNSIRDRNGDTKLM